MNQPRLCIQCRGALPGNAPEGLCPACLLKLGAAELGLNLEVQNEQGRVQNAREKAQLAEPGRQSKEAELESKSSPEKQGNSTPAVPWSCGSRFGNYELLERIGRGGMGAVYKARQLNLDRIVALKLLPLGAWSGAEAVQRFRSEAKAAAALQHPNIVAVHDVGEHEGQPFYSMDFVEGRTLSELVRDQPLPATRAATYLKSIAEAVHYAHQRGILHRDLKPSNILVDTTDQPRITDFGLAKRLHGDSDLTLTGQVLGSPNFISPEQAEGRSEAIGAACDVYSLGALLYHLLTRQPPFQADTLTALLKQVLEAEPVPPRLFNPSIPTDLETICLKCLEKEPRRRYATAQELADELNRFLCHEPVLARPVGAGGRLLRWCRRKPVRAGLSGALGLVLALGMIGISWQWRRAEHEHGLALHHAYAAGMNLAQVALDSGDLGAAVALLDEHRPAAGRQDLRGWEWRYMWQRCRSDELFELTHSATVIDQVAFSSNNWAVARDERGSLAVWDITSRVRVCSFETGGPLNPFVCSQRSNLLAYTLTVPAHVKVVSLSTRRELATLPLSTNAMLLAFSTDASRLFTFAEDGTFAEWDIASRQALRQVRLPGKYLSRAAGSPALSAEGVIACQVENRLGLWKPASDRQILLTLTVRGKDSPVLSFSPDGRLLAAGVGESDSEVYVWQTEDLWRAVVETPPPRARLGKHRDWISEIAFSADSRALATAGADSALRVWDLDHPEVCRRYQGHRHQVLSVAWGSDGKYIISSGMDGSVRVWDPSREPSVTAPRVLPVSSRLWRFGISRDGKRALALDKTNGVAVVWDTFTMAPTEVLTFAGTNNTAVDWSPDGRLLVTGDDLGNVRVWELATRRGVAHMVFPGYWVATLHFSHDGRFLVCGIALGRPIRERSARLYDLAERREIPLPREALEGLLFADVSGRFLASLHWGGALDIWDLGRGLCLVRLAQPLARPRESGIVKFCPNGRILASSTERGVVCLWDTTGRRPAPVVIPRSAQELWHLEFSPDGTRLLVSGKRASDVVRLLDPSSGRFVGTLSGKPDKYFHVGMSGDNTTVFAVGTESVLLWRAPSWAEIEQAEKGKRSP